MKVVVLIDNNPHPELKLQSEHGLSIYFEADGFKWLFDTGASDKFYSNALSMRIKIEEIDFLVLSHGHNDHTGGLEDFIRLNHKAQIFISANIKGENYFSYRHKPKRNISINYDIVKENINRFVLAKGNMQISENVSLICDIPRIYETPRANNKLYQWVEGTEVLDDFNHEVVLAVNTSNGIVVFSGCSHNGVLNILEACSNTFNKSKIIACIGGTHLVDGDSDNVYESDTEIKEIGRSLINRYPDMKLITGHCTDTNAQKKLRTVMGDNFRAFHCGAVIEI